MFQLCNPLILQPTIPFHHHPSTRSTSLHCRSTSVAVRHSSDATTATTLTVTNNNHSIQSLCKKGQLKKALHLLSLESNPTQRTYELLLLACAHRKSLSDALIVQRNLFENGFGDDNFLATKLINVFSELDSIEHARQVFNRITLRSIYVWNAFLRALSLSGHGEEVLNLYREMNRIGIPSNRFTYTFALKACVVSESHLSLLWRGKEIHAHILRHGCENHVHVMTTLLDMYAKYACIESASYVFLAMPVRNVVSWSAMIACYAKNRRPLEALEVFREMMVERDESMLPNSVTMVGVLQAIASIAALEQGKLIHGYILRKGLDSILPVLSALMTMYARCGDLELAIRVFNLMDKRNVISWNSLISSYAVHGLGEKAIEVFQEMIRRGVSPSPITFVSVLGACSHSGLVDEGRYLFDSMAKEHKIHPNLEHYACMVDLLGRANLLEEAAKFIQDMRVEPDANVWGSLLGSCKIHCNIELAERASQRLFELEPTNAGNYVLLGDIYARANMWDKVKRVKNMLEAKGLQKVSGCSWIEVERKTYALKSTDEFNPQIEQIHALLLKLTMELKEEGYIPETNVVQYDVSTEEKERIVLGHSEKLAVAFGLINCSKGEPIRITKNLRLCEDCHSFTKFVSKFASKEILVRDINRFHHFKDGECSCCDYW